MKKQLFIFAIMLPLIAIFISGCSEQLINSSESNSLTTDFIGSLPTGDNGPANYLQGVTYCGTPKIVDLFAGQTTDAGSVTVYNDDINIYITVYSSYGYQDGTEQIKLWIGADSSLIPKNNAGVPVNGQFPHKITTTQSVNVYTFSIPLANLSLVTSCGNSVFLVIHADVLASNDGGVTITPETAYGGDIVGNTGNRWWYLTNYTIQCCGGTSNFGKKETAFAKGGWVWTTDVKSNPEKLPSLRLTKNRWGWAINLPLVNGTTNYDIYAGAGLNDIKKGVKAGSLNISINGSNVTVTYNMLNGFKMSEAHIYANDFKPTTIAPGQFGHTMYFNSLASTATATFNLFDTNNDGIWIIAHSVVNY